MKVIKIFYLLFTVCFLALFTFLFQLKSNTILTSEIRTEIPLSAAFKQLILTTTHQSYVNPKALDSVRITFHYFKNRHPISVTYRPEVNFERHRLVLKPTHPAMALQPFKSVSHAVYLRKLIDGTTNIRWEIRYRVPGISARLLNRLFWESQFHRFLEHKSAELKTYFH